jgi:hypothetical protein
MLAQNPLAQFNLTEGSKGITRSRLVSSGMPPQKLILQLADFS